MFYLFTGSTLTPVHHPLLDANSINVQPGTRGELQFLSSGPTPGVLLWVESSVTAMDLQEYVANSSVSTPGVVLPAVRQRDVQTGVSVHMLSVPLSTNARTLVRLYDLSFLGQVDVRVTVYSVGGTSCRGTSCI